MTKYTIDYIKKNNLLLLDVICGSHAYGLNTPTSDVDKRGIFIMEEDDYNGLNYVEQISDEKNDIVYYELRRFLQLALQGNPNILELLSVDEEHIIHKDPLIDLLKPEYFLSKKCRNTFGGYAIAQIKKARGLNKKIVNPIDKERKTPLDFCYFYDTSSSRLIKECYTTDELEKCGLSKYTHGKDLYCLHTDNTNDYKFRGFIKPNSNELRLSSIPKEYYDTVWKPYHAADEYKPNSVVTIWYNKDGYTKYCKDYKLYWDWVEERNPDRYKTNQEHGKGYDSKNLMHCYRLLQMAKEIALGEGIIVKRPNREFLLKIRKGEMGYDELVDGADILINDLDKLFEGSNLPDKPNYNKVNEILIKIRTTYWV